MSWVDLAIVVVLSDCNAGRIGAGILPLRLFLAGLGLGLELAAWNYERLAAIVRPIIPVEAVDNVIGFLVIALLVMAVANIVGGIISETVHKMGLGCLDKLAGAVFGFLQGALLVTLVILVTVAFFPETEWLAEARLPQMFFGACHLSTNMTPGELAERVRMALKLLEQESPEWMHPGNGTSVNEIWCKGQKYGLH